MGYKSFDQSATNALLRSCGAISLLPPKFHPAADDARQHAQVLGARHLLYLIPAVVLACVIGPAVGQELSKNDHLGRQIKYVMGCAALLVLFALFVDVLGRLLD